MGALQKIVVIGGGLAAHMSVAAMSKRLPDTIDITFVKTSATEAQDIFYGNITSPSTYDFLLGLAISEPQLLLNTNTSFSLGTKYVGWGSESRSWTQAFYKPLPIHDGVKFHHYVNRVNNGALSGAIDPYIMSVEAAKKGVFAHPPEGKNIPLASVNYGYHFSSVNWVQLLAKTLNAARVKVITANKEQLVSISRTANSLTLADGLVVEGDLFIDCRELSHSAHNEAWHESRLLSAYSETSPQSKINAVTTALEKTSYGWRARTPLRDQHITTYFYHPRDKTLLPNTATKTETQSTITVGRTDMPWTDNVLKLGHRAGAIEPLSPAPIMLLQQDIERLIELIPTNRNMSVEAREYNRRFVQDFDNAAIFHRALFQDQASPANQYEKTIITPKIPYKLQVKITQFESRGICVLFDNELFNEEDWTLLHLGIGRTPTRYDPLANRLSKSQIEQMLSNMELAISKMSTKMPPIDIYMAGLLKFLKNKHG